MVGRLKLSNYRGPQVRREILRRTRDDAVVVLGIELSLSEALSSSGRAAIEVRAPGRAAVELLRDGFCGNRHAVNGTITVVPLALHNRQPGGVAREVPGIGAHRGISILACGGQGCVTNRGREA